MRKRRRQIAQNQTALPSVGRSNTLTERRTTYPIERKQKRADEGRNGARSRAGVQHIQKLSQAQTVLSVENSSLKTRLSGPLRDAKRYLEVEALREEVERLKAIMKFDDQIR